MEFAALDDDLFCEERQRYNPDGEYSARFCENCWFLEAPNDLLVSDEDKFSVQKHSADYLFYKKDFLSALDKYESILNNLPASNTTVRRECYEGISRSCMKLMSFAKAFEYAEKLHFTSKTIEQTTVSCSALIDAGIAANEYSRALETAQLMVTIHPYNADVWLKLAHCYASIYDISLHSMKEPLINTHVKESIDEVCERSEVTNVDSTRTVCELPISSSQDYIMCRGNGSSNSNSKCEENIIDSESETIASQLTLESIKVIKTETNADDLDDIWKEMIHDPLTFSEREKGAQFVCGCLYRSFMMLKRTEGTSFGFALDSNLAWQKRLWSDMKAVLDKESLNFVIFVVKLCDHSYSNSSPVKESSSEFIDRGSSKFKSDNAEINISEISLNFFEKQWFKWIK